MMKKKHVNCEKKEKKLSWSGFELRSFVWKPKAFPLSDAYRVYLNAWDVSGSYELDVIGQKSVYSIMQEFGMVPQNLYYMKTPTEAKWVAGENWTYTNYFNGTSLIMYDNINLVIECSDTFANIVLNGKSVGKTDNMFVPYKENIKKYLHKDLNELTIEFVSPLLYANAESLKYDYVIPPECPYKDYDGDCHINKIRKMQSSFGSSWGPSIPSMGLWKDVYVEAYDDSLLTDIVIDTVNVGTHWKINIDAYFENRKQVVHGILELSTYINDSIYYNYTIDIKSNSYGELVWNTSILMEAENNYLWWPNGYGNQNVYFLTATFTSTRGDVSVATTGFAFRTVELVQEPIGNNGLSFYFKINNVPIFAKGANLLPNDMLLEKSEYLTYLENLILLAKKSNMNMLRISGAGLYEASPFYDMADQYGILIWQDFMFASALYPADETFLQNVAKEVRYQVKKLCSHPSIVIFSGNAESERGLSENWWNLTNKTKYEEDYLKLFVETIKSEFDRITHGRGIYVTSTPSNGKQTEIEGYISNEPNSHFYGDMHVFNYRNDLFDPNTYPIPRFVSEYGFQSLPQIDSLQMDTNSVNDLSITGDFMAYRQHQPYGNEKLFSLIDNQLRLPSDNKTKNYNLAVIYYSQIIQAYSLKIQTERYRNYRSILTNDGRGKTMGALYWHLNDVWTAPTWSSLDYYGKWKILQYFAANFFSPILFNAHLEEPNVLNFYVVTDHESVKEKGTIKFYSWGNPEPVMISHIHVDVLPGSSQLVHQYSNLEETLANFNCTPKTCFLTLSLPCAPENFYFLAKLKESTVNNAKVEMSQPIFVNGSNAIEFTVSSDNIALFVWLEAHGFKGHFSENGFVLTEGQKKITFYISDTPYPVSNLEKILTDNFITVTHLKDPAYFSDD